MGLAILPKKLVKKLDAYGIRETELSWFHSYLSERKQRVILNGEHSEWTNVAMGVPQGSILGPLLFLLFLPDVVEDCSVNLYADDTTIYSSDEDPKELCSRVEEDLERVRAWDRRKQIADQCDENSANGAGEEREEPRSQRDQREDW